MHRKSTLVSAVILFMLFAITFAMLKPNSAQAQQNGKPTVLEGMALDEEGEPLYKSFGSGSYFKLYRDGALADSGYFDLDKGGLYRWENLKPGVYDIMIERRNNNFRPLRIQGVVLKSGVTTRLDITMHKGEKLEVIGKPVLDPEPAIIISEHLEKMQKQIDALKKENEELKARLEKLEKK